MLYKIKKLMVVGLLLIGNFAYAVDYTAYPTLQKLVDKMVAEDDYPRPELVKILKHAKIDKSVIRSISRPYESLTWDKYRALFINDKRIADGVKFWNKHSEILQQASREFGIPAEIIVALIGVETHYGTRLGDNRVLDSLVTLTAEYPRRAAFFGRELRVFLNTVRRENIAAQSVFGSYAGAVGIPQFMPSSYQAYAVDFNQNGKRDLGTETADAIGSVANYLQKHGWISEHFVATKLPQPLPDKVSNLVTNSAKPKLTLGQIKAVGLEISPELNTDINAAAVKVAVVKLQQMDAPLYILTSVNFYALTRYNPSNNYAFAIVELANAITEYKLNLISNDEK